jgi:hypothetical protein
MPELRQPDNLESWNAANMLVSIEFHDFLKKRAYAGATGNFRGIGIRMECAGAVSEGRAFPLATPAVPPILG